MRGEHWEMGDGSWALRDERWEFERREDESSRSERMRSEIRDF